jgi:hypothetical protein
MNDRNDSGQPHAAVDDDRLAGDVARIGRGQERHHSGNVLRGLQTSQRIAATMAAISDPGRVPVREAMASAIESHIGVCTTPGLQTLTVIWCSASSWATDWLNPHGELRRRVGALPFPAPVRGHRRGTNQPASAALGDHLSAAAL